MQRNETQSAPPRLYSVEHGHLFVPPISAGSRRATGRMRRCSGTAWVRTGAPCGPWAGPGASTGIAARPGCRACLSLLGGLAGSPWLCLSSWPRPGRLAWHALLRARAPYNEINEPEVSLFRYAAAV